MSAALLCLCGHDVTVHELTPDGVRSGKCTACSCAPTAPTRGRPADFRRTVRRLAARHRVFLRALRLIGGLVCLALAGGVSIGWLVVFLIHPPALGAWAQVLAIDVFLLWVAYGLIRGQRPAPRHRPAAGPIALGRSAELERLLSDMEKHNLRHAERRRRNVPPLAGRSWRPIRQRNKQRSGR